MFYFSISNFLAEQLMAGFLQGAIALGFLALLIRNIYITRQERNLFKKKDL